MPQIFDNPQRYGVKDFYWGIDSRIEPYNINWFTLLMKFIKKDVPFNVKNGL